MSTVEKQKTLVIVKPGAFKRRQAGLILADIQNRLPQLAVTEVLLVRFDEQRAKEFYKEHDGRQFFSGLVEHTTSGPCLAILLEGPDAIAKVREVIGPTDPSLGHVNFHLRPKYSHALPDNAIHASDSRESFAREYEIAFHWGAAQAVIAGLWQDLAALRKSDPEAFPPAGQTIAGAVAASVPQVTPESAVVDAAPGSSETAGG